jgi:site-specific DNA-cytosine methylase
MRGMGVDFEVFNFADLGVAQTRKRVIAGSPHIVQALREEAGKNPPLSVRDVIPHCRGEYIRNGTTTTWKVVNGVKRQIPLTVDHPSFARHVSEPAYTITGNSPLRWYSPSGCSVFTPEELALLQGFPKTYQLHAKRGLSYQHVGNAIPPPIISLIVKAAKRPERFPTRRNKSNGSHQLARRSRRISRRDST